MYLYHLVPVRFSRELHLSSAIPNVVGSHTFIHSNIPVCDIFNDESEVGGVPGQCAHSVQQQVIVIPHNIGTGVALNVTTDVCWPVRLTLLANNSFQGFNMRRILTESIILLSDKQNVGKWLKSGFFPIPDKILDFNDIVVNNQVSLSPQQLNYQFLKCFILHWTSRSIESCAGKPAPLSAWQW